MSAIAVELDHIPFLDLQAEYRELAQDGLETEILASSRKAQYIHGNAVHSFEKNWAAYCGTAEAVAMDSGTAALEIAMKALGMARRRGHRPGAYLHRHGRRRRSLRRPPGLRRCRSAHLAARPHPHSPGPHPAYPRRHRSAPLRATCNLEELAALRRKHRLLLIEDAAQAQGATFGKRRVGSFGAVGCFSFYPQRTSGPSAMRAPSLPTIPNSPSACGVFAIMAVPRNTNMPRSEKISAWMRCRVLCSISNCPTWTAGTGAAGKLRLAIAANLPISRSSSPNWSPVPNPCTTCIPSPPRDATNFFATSPPAASTPESTIPCPSTSSRLSLPWDIVAA